MTTCLEIAFYLVYSACLSLTFVHECMCVHAYFNVGF